MSPRVPGFQLTSMPSDLENLRIRILPCRNPLVTQFLRGIIPVQMR